ncbi:response regulator [Coraliomargarita sp. SDUM461004]|uniref:Response regulator n=1 Tax=Thalassobacterium sedimentorum TaxID=3041258 RepID=A0ABU1AEI3_9BACT|nr:response regulator [Coraliomargarita sp. SDUM461004]MDQ8193179.1 response regulator [Coraliomargarita sp. SDUM461004]
MIKLRKNPTAKDARRVLVIDDEPSFTRMVKLNLEDTGNYIVETLNESRKALITAKTFEPEIILLDVVMPEADGGDVALQLRSRQATQHIPIIFVSAMVSQKESKKGFYQSGGEHFLAKPIDKDTLCGAIETVLSTAH